MDWKTIKSTRVGLNVMALKFARMVFIKVNHVLICQIEHSWVPPVMNSCSDNIMHQYLIINIITVTRPDRILILIVDTHMGIIKAHLLYHIDSHQIRVKNGHLLVITLIITMQLRQLQKVYFIYGNFFVERYYLAKLSSATVKVNSNGAWITSMKNSSIGIGELYPNHMRVHYLFKCY